ncbi:nucleotide exchange factor GrpE [Tamlana sp. s12]|uniref:nucleotide exchange factor GrpE n=1 Tax=Tamlana sp. s12 TaxID=1630406 RepID=UPI0007FEA159|nr:nucleotide exchange factor GrpE [Tamlana sp. s12]OBQ56472.1 molecular chaperone GrpE [Tamlana sp. s12]QQY81904.1 nucleotide exchange factor GrpE [Tamlana sp. s12]
MSKEDKNNDIESEQVDGVQNETVEVEEQVAEEQAVEETVEEKLEAELKQEKEKFLRLFAEFENYKRRTSKERMELFSTASEGVMKTLLPVLDDFERALSHIEDDKEAEELRKGVLLIYQKLVNTLGQKGLKVMEVEKGDVFNADSHEAITQIPAPNDDLKGKIIDIVEKGYLLGEKIIRFPKVVIGQ